MVKTDEDYKRAFDAVTRVVNSWDPYGLIELGCPPDEFDVEVGDILGRLREISSPQDASRVLSEVFSRWFSPEDFPILRCIDPGQNLYIALLKEEFVP